MSDIINENLISLKDLCNLLSVSIATGKNWIKLGKIVPTSSVDNVQYFSLDYAIKIKNSIQNQDNSFLKSRRNKKYVSGNSFYSSYISQNSKNLQNVENIINAINDLELGDVKPEIISTVIVYYARQWVCGKNLFLLDDIVESFGYSEDFIINNPQIFSYVIEYEPNEDVLGLLYLSLRNLGIRKSTGAYYTPTNIVKKLCANLFNNFDYKDKTVLDPCCGTGNFILQLPVDCLAKDVFASDIDLMSVLITRINYALKFNVVDKNLICSNIRVCNCLEKTFDEKYDLIIGNPPWGFEFSDEEKLFLQKKYDCAVSSNIESYDVVVEQSLRNLKNDGVLSFVLPEAFLNVKTHTPIRKFLMKENSIRLIEYFGDVFNGVQCPSVNIQFVHDNKPFSISQMRVLTKKKSFVIGKNRKVFPSCFNFLMTDEEYLLIEKISSNKNVVTLKNNAIFALGIVTGNNSKYISSTKTSANELILKGGDICKYRFKNPEYYINFEPDNFQQVAPIEVYRAEEKLFYKFISNNLIFAYDNQQTLSLNSCNIVIPQINGLSVKYVMAFLNSSVAQFFFKKQFNSIKVLRSHIEQIPIIKCDKSLQVEVENLVDEIIVASDDKYKKLCKMLDEKIAKMYGLSESEYFLLLDDFCK